MATRKRRALRDVGAVTAIMAQCRKEAIEWTEKHMPHKTFLLERAFTTRSTRACINAKCNDCTSFQVDEIRCCEAYACPLWNARPYQKRENV